MASQDSEHVPLEALWNFEKQKAVLTHDKMVHLNECGDCQMVMSICKVCDTVESAQIRLKAHRHFTDDCP